MNPLDCIRIDTGKDPLHSVIWLHGLGADGHDFEPLVPELSWSGAPAIRFIFPHAPRRPVTINAGMVMRAWYDISEMNLNRGGDEAGIRASAELVENLIAIEEARGASGIVLAGFSQGGAIALYAGLRRDRPLAGIIGLSTYLPLVEALARERRAGAQQTPILMGHGRSDPMIPISLAQLSAERLKSWGYPLEWHSYDVAHGVVPEEVADIRTWLQRRFDPRAGNSSNVQAR